MTASPHINFRAQGDLLAELSARGGAQEPQTTHLAKRELARYYYALREALRSVHLGEAEWALITESLRETTIPDDMPFGSVLGILWDQYTATVYIRGIAGQWGKSNPALVERLKTLSHCETLAVVDACERWHQAWRQEQSPGGPIVPSP